MKLRNLCMLFGILLAIAYIAFTVAAFLKYPTHYSPLNNWLSDLGNVVISPDGSRYYNAGIVITGILTAAFFVTLRTLRSKTIKAQAIILTLVQVFGILGSVAMVLSAIYPINTRNLHSIFSALIYINLGTSFGLTVALFRYNSRTPRWILVYGGLTALVDLVVSIFFNQVPVLEWLVVFLFISYCVIVGIETNRSGGMSGQEDTHAVA